MMQKLVPSDILEKANADNTVNVKKKEKEKRNTHFNEMLVLNLTTCNVKFID